MFTLVYTLSDRLQKSLGSILSEIMQFSSSLSYLQEFFSLEKLERDEAADSSAARPGGCAEPADCSAVRPEGCFGDILFDHVSFTYPDSDQEVLHDISVRIRAGEKIALLRAVYRNRANIMILDEPTAALDPLAEAQLYRDFSRITGNRTTLLISHRLDITGLVDRILVFRDGRIIEDGSHQELMAAKGHYYFMYLAQEQWYQ